MSMGPRKYYVRTREATRQHTLAHLRECGCHVDDVDAQGTIVRLQARVVNQNKWFVAVLSKTVHAVASDIVLHTRVTLHAPYAHKPDRHRDRRTISTCTLDVYQTKPSQI
jgi:hypothetical protein